MVDIALLLGATALLSFFCWWIQKRVQGLVILLTGSRAAGIYVYSLVFLPGVMLHELAHFFCAAFLGVRTGEIALLPRLFDDDEGRVALGSVQIAKTDFLRGSLIGAAPFFVGSLLLYVIAHLQFPALLQVSNLSEQAYRLSQPITYLWLYAVLTIANTMFPSREDSRAWPILTAFLVLLSLVIWWGGSGGRVVALVLPQVTLLARALGASFLLAAVFDLVLAVFLFLIQTVLERILRRRIVY